jgi:hypothetical protein
MKKMARISPSEILRQAERYPIRQSDYTDYLLAEVARLQEQLATLTKEIKKWTITK